MASARPDLAAAQAPGRPVPSPVGPSGPRSEGSAGEKLLASWYRFESAVASRVHALRSHGGFMAGRVFGFENPDRFVAGAIGQPGSRIFYLQAREGGRVTSVALEKVQVALLAERLTQLMKEVQSR